MAKVIKLKLSDIENIVKKTISEAQFDDFDTKIQPEELPGYEDYEAEKELEKEMGNEEQPQDTSDVVIGKDKEGNIVVVDTNSGNILGQK
jgi:hypothetical protein